SDLVHAGVVRGRPVHALRGGSHAAVDVPGADHERGLDAGGLHRDDLFGDGVNRLAVHAVLAGAHQRFARELEQDAPEHRTQLGRGRGRFVGLDVHYALSSNRSNSSTSAPSSSSASPTFFEESWIHSWSSSTLAPKKRLFSMPSTILSRACSGFDCTSSVLA